MIDFERDVDDDKLRPEESVGNLSALISLLCGQPIAKLDEDQNAVLGNFLARLKAQQPSEPYLTYEQFNELLLLFNQQRIGKPFFSFFFQNQHPSQPPSAKAIKLRDLGHAVSKFRGFAMLSFGNFRFAFRTLGEETDGAAFSERLEPWIVPTEQRKAELDNRPTPILIGPKEQVSGDETWQLGYIATNYLYDDVARLYVLEAKVQGHTKQELLRLLAQRNALPQIVQRVERLWPMISKSRVSRWRENLHKLRAEADRLLGQIEANRIKGGQNTVRYLTSDFVDVYVATSMRDRWEFSETYETVKKIFGDNELRDLKLRWFDPTQSYEPSVLDKGLLEGLMLKRVRCTVYMAQEGETLGKDSELAATLAQGKPVIAYVPRVRNEDREPFAVKLRGRDLLYFVRRLLILKAEGFFNTHDTLAPAGKYFSALTKSAVASEWEGTKRLAHEAGRVLDTLSSFETGRTFRLISQEEDVFKRDEAHLMDTAAKLLAACETVSWDKRAEIIAKDHPLAMQLDLRTGVANGVLVVRSIKECARMIRGVLLNDLKFRIDKEEGEKGGERLATVLKESETGSRFRVVTTNPTLTNSFWNFYLQEW